MSSPTKETLLVYNMQNTAKGKLLKLICMQMGIRVRAVEKEEFLWPGLKGWSRQRSVSKAKDSTMRC